MRVYIPKREYKFTYPDAMKKIMNYLEEHGEVKVSPKTIENFYYEFSDDRYCAGWKGVDDETLAEFAEWLSEKEI